WSDVQDPPSQDLQAYLGEHYFGTSGFPEDRLENSARDLAERFLTISGRAKSLGQRLGINLDPLRLQFLIPRPVALDTAGATFMSEGIPVSLESAQERWDSLKSVFQSVSQSAQAGGELKLETLLQWIPGVSLLTTNANLDYLKSEFERFSETFAANL